MTATVESHPTRTGRRVPLSVTVSAWAVPLMVVGQFALIAGVPVVIALVGALRRVPDRAVRRAATLVSVTFAIPLVVWLTRPDGAPSLSKDMHPGFAGLIVAASAALIVTLHRARRHLPAR
ncbi:hypothetical protein OIE62_03030 [Streptomyces scopuliridis]|uniref:Uncharacterized protein n=2 Tax=Streptomyces scopuliridis TaxID=452529 RepID=A0A2T7T4D8_9ACTN|nr:hypothetical protein [Streptomyces scopuliridis]PVE10017.1 hypothetical protein Y717_15780 [Streptomyces scopuliridis RB72]WSB37920.1 hypothetical protein OG949_37215 [Streptomyces scopuliridis]WSC02372.1 hypothetical protein OG835_38800 [Streptomyces scopuliridis]WSC04091.1 hypothetical protein OIE62_03030 [Streptomyces scopuliridis]